ncbi:MAG: LPS-assembly protein LptD, partial [Runella slithyformis]
ADSAGLVGLGFKWDNVPTRPLNSSDLPTTLPIDSTHFREILGNAQFTGRYSIPIALPNLKWKNYFNLTPGISFSGELYQKRNFYEYKGNNRVNVTDSGPSFANNVSFSASLNTRVYGMFMIKGKRLEAIRHTLIPSASISYVPDQSNLYQSVQINERGEERFLNRYGAIGKRGSVGRSAAGISWSLNNLLEAKIRPKSDSSGKEFEKMNLLDNLSINGSYNLTADAFKVSDININANTQLFKNLNINVGATFDPYAYVMDKASGDRGRKIDTLAITQGKGLARLSNVNVALSTRFAPKGADKKKKKSAEGTEEQLKFINANPELYVDFNIPWTVNLSYQFNYTRQGLAPAQTIQTLRINGDFSLTPKWKFVLDTGIDFEAKAPSITTLQVTRDLHCWEMSFN